MKRRSFINTLGLTAASFSLLNFTPSFFGSTSYFTITKVNGRFFLKDPNGNLFFSIGINHVDSSPLRYIENMDIWQGKYENSMEAWLKKDVHVNLNNWGFNTIGWNQEVVTINPRNHRHSRSFTPEEYKWLDMPYCHMLHFADFHQWEAETINPDFFSVDFSDWCDFVARDEVARLANDPNLIGYFYMDCPTWVHTTKYTQWKGPLFDPEKLKTESGRKDLFKMASQYYKVTHDAIRRYDKNHLIFGDRYEARKLLAKEVIMAAAPYIDVLSFQHFAKPLQINTNLNYWHDLTGLPTILADSSHQTKDPVTGYMMHKLDGYPNTYKTLKENNSCIGYHLCGAYLENRARKRGLLREDETPHAKVVEMMTSVNSDMKEWVSEWQKSYTN